jgi:site-specific recombinase XerD
MNIGKYIEMYSNDLKLKNYSQNTIDNYCSQVKCFLEYFNSVATKPSEISENKIKEWLLLANSINSRKHRISAVKLFYKYTGKQPLKFKHIEYPRSEKKLPIVLSQQEIQGMFNACTNIKQKVMLSLLYSCGLRVSELINLRWKDIDRSRMVVNIIKAKGSKDRQVMLEPTIIPLLEKYYHEYHPKEFVLNGQKSLQYSDRSVGEVIKQLAERSGIKNKRVYTHLMRHCSFTHLCESGVDINIIQKLAGHSNVKTTMIYTHISHNLISKIPSPLSQINL